MGRVYNAYVLDAGATTPLSFRRNGQVEDLTGAGPIVIWATPPSGGAAVEWTAGIDVVAASVGGVEKTWDEELVEASIEDVAGTPDAHWTLQMVATIGARPAIYSDLITLRVGPSMGPGGSSATPLSNQYAYPDADADGIVHLYVVASTGNDLYLGSAAQPLATYAEAVRRYERWLLLGLDQEFHIQVAGDVSAESVTMVLPCTPRRRLLIDSLDATMTVLASGNVAGTSASTYMDRNGGSAFTVDALVGKTVRILLAGAVIGRAEVQRNTASRITFCQELSFAPSALHTFQVVEPSVELDELTMILWGPAGLNAGNGCIRENELPAVIIRNQRFGSFRQVGGEVSLTACETVTAAVTGGGLMRGGQLAGSPLATDPLLGIPANDYDIWSGCGPHITGAVGLFVEGSTFWGTFAATGLSGGIYVTGGAHAYAFGGAVVGGSGVGVADNSEAIFYGGGYVLTTLPFVVKGTAAGISGFRCKNKSMLRTEAVELDDLGAGSNGFLAEADSLIEILGGAAGVTVAAAADIPGNGARAETFSKILIKTGVTFPSIGAELIADAVTGSHASLTATPIAGARGAWIVRET